MWFLTKSKSSCSLGWEVTLSVPCLFLCILFVPAHCCKSGTSLCTSPCPFTAHNDPRGRYYFYVHCPGEESEAMIKFIR